MKSRTIIVTALLAAYAAAAPFVLYKTIDGNELGRFSLHELSSHFGIGFRAIVAGISGSSNIALLSGPGSGLIGYWSFDNVSGSNVPDDSGNGNTGTKIGAAIVAGKIGSALDFDGVDDYVWAPDSASLDSITNAMSVTAWVKKQRDEPTWGSIVGRRYGGGSGDLWQIMYRNSSLDEYLGTIVNDDVNLDGPSSLSPTNDRNVWIHWAMTHDGTIGRLYRNGVQVVTEPSTITIPDEVTPLMIGAGENPGPSQFVDAVIDEVRFYDRALTAGEVSSLAGDTTAPAISGVGSGSITSTGATISWTTAGESSSSQVEYGTTASYGSMSSLNTTLVTSHTVILNGLAPGTLYHYRVRSKDAADNLGVSSDFTFTTSAGAPPTPLYHWKLNENTSTSVANSGSALGGVLTRTTPKPAWSTNVPTLAGGASSVDFWTNTTTGSYGVDSSGTLSSLANMSTFTVTGWLNNRNSTEGSGGNRIVTWINNGGDGVDIVYKTDGSIMVGIDQWPDSSLARSSAGKIPTSSGAPASNWTFFAVSYEPSLSTGDVKFYFGTNTVDATLDQADTYDRGNVGATIGPTTLGNFNVNSAAARADAGNSRMFRGLIDDVRVYGSALPLSTIVGIQRSDGVPPILSAGGPTGTLQYGTTATTLVVTTGEPATCRLSTTPPSSYGSMSNNFNTTGGTSHSENLSGLSGAQPYTAYTYYVRCQDVSGNANTSDYVISFSIDGGPPVRSNGAPTGTLPGGTTSTTLSLDTNEVAECRYMLNTPEIAFASMTGLFDNTDATTHSEPVSGLQNGASYIYYVRCEDGLGNENTSDYDVISFSVQTVDSTPPTRSAGNPSGTLPSNTTQVTLSLATVDENAFCRLSDSSGTAYSAMTTNFGTAVPGPTSGLVSHWKFDDNTSINADDAVSTNNGTLTNGPTWVAGELGPAVMLDGIDDYVNVPDAANLDGMGAITVSTWMKATALPVQPAVIVGKDSSTPSYRIQLNSNGTGHFTVATTLNAWYSAGTVASWSTNFVPGTWYHVAGTYDGKNVKVYVNGVIEGISSPDISGSIVSSNSPLRVGYKSAANVDYFKGAVDDVRVYNRSLSAAEVETLAVVPGPTAGLTAHWTLDDNIGTNANDSIGVLDGTLVGNPAWTAGKLGQAVDFDGVDDHINLPPNTSLFRNVGSATFAGWVYSKGPVPAAGVSLLAASVNNGGVPTASSRFFVVLSSGGTVAAGGRAPDSQASTQLRTTSASIPVGVWTHVTAIVTYTNDNIEIFFDGVWQSTTGSPNFTNQNTDNTNSASAAIGSEDNGVGGYGPVILDDVRLYNRALTGPEVLQLISIPGGTSHTLTIPVTHSEAYSHYVRCIDNFGNTNTTDYPITFSVAPVDTTASVRSNGVPTGTLPSSTTSVTISLTTNEPASCRLSSNSGTLYSDMSTNLTHPTTAPTSGLVGHWALNEISGTSVADSSGSNNVGTVYGNPVWTKGALGNALSFDGTNNDDYVRIPDSNNSLDVTRMTHSYWVYKKANIVDGLYGVVSGRQYSTGSADIFGLDYDTDATDRSILYTRTSGGQGYVFGPSTTAEVNTWVHYAGTYDGTTLHLYKSGTLVASSSHPFPGNMVADSTSVTFGGMFNGPGADAGFSELVNARLDEFRLYNRALTAGEVSTLASIPLTHEYTFAVSPGTYNHYIRCEDAFSNTNSSDYQISFIIPQPDSTPPVITNTTPATFLVTTTSATMTVTTNEAATCKWNPNSGISYDHPSMTLFNTTSGISHSTAISPVTFGQSVTRYVKCRDVAGNANPTDTQINFSIDPPPPAALTALDRVRTIVDADVRSGAGYLTTTPAPPSFQPQPQNAYGQLIGATYIVEDLGGGNEGHWWWNINYDTHGDGTESPDGWSKEQDLEEVPIYDLDIKEN